MIKETHKLRLTFPPKIFWLIILALGVGLIGGCGKKEKSAESNAASAKLNIVTTTGILADAARNVGGELTTVTALMGPGVDPHLYKASEGDVARLTKADVIIYNGLHLEGKMGDILEKMARTRQVIAAGELISESKLLAPPQFAGHPDPHIWFDLSIWAEMVTELGKKFGEIDSLHRDTYLQNSKAYAEKILAIHERTKQLIASIPDDQRVLISAHDAFGYFGQAYHVDVRGLQGISTVSEYGLADVTELVNFIAERKIKAIFVETSVPTKSIEAVQKGVQQRNHNVLIGGALYSDALGAVGTPAETYLGMVNENVNTIVNALK